MENNPTESFPLFTDVLPSTSVQQDADANNTTSDSLLVVKLTCFSAISFVGIIGNILICAKLLRSKRKSSECFILNLALTDLMVCGIGIPLDIYEQLHRTWIYGAALCKVVWPCQTLLVLVSILTLTAMSLERYRVIITPLKPKLKKLDILKAIVVIWIMSIAIVFPYINALTYSHGVCDEIWAGARDKDYYTLALFIIDYCIPLSIITYCYARVGFRLYKSNLQFNDSPTKHSHRDSKIQNHAQRNRLQRNTRIIKVFGFAVVMFVVCMLPGDIFWMWSSWGQVDFVYQDHFKTFANILLYANSAINPFIFGTCNVSCFQTFCLRRKQNNTSYSLRFSFTSSFRRRHRKRENVYSWRRVARRVKGDKANGVVVWETNV